MLISIIVQQCILQVLEPICEAKFHERSNGFRPNRSAEHAIAQCCKMIQTQHLYFVVDVDIKGFFDNVNHSKLIKQLWTMGVRDKKLLCIIKAMLKAPIIMPNGDKIYPEKGTPQGGILSPLLANVVLNELDWWIDSQWENMPTHRYIKTYPLAIIFIPSVVPLTNANSLSLAPIKFATSFLASAISLSTKNDKL